MSVHGDGARVVQVAASSSTRHATRMQDDVPMIASLSVQHQHRFEDDLEPWDEYAVTAELRTFRVTIVQLQDGGFGTQITETIGRPGVPRHERLLASSAAPSWHGRSRRFCHRSRCPTRPVAAPPPTPTSAERGT